jgi:VIT1/CCC1 family predicted Fe2+/Mn2+ transporter
MSGQSKGFDGDRAEFDRIVARLYGQPAAAPRPGAAVKARRPPLQNGAFVAISLAVIIPMSIVAGGWLGLIAVVVSTVVAGLLLIEPHQDGARTARR